MSRSASLEREERIRDLSSTMARWEVRVGLCLGWLWGLGFRDWDLEAEDDIILV